MMFIFLFVLFKQSLPFRSYQAGTKFPSSIKTVLTLPELRQVAVPQIPLPCLPRKLHRAFNCGLGNFAGETGENKNSVCSIKYPNLEKVELMLEKSICWQLVVGVFWIAHGFNIAQPKLTVNNYFCFFFLGILPICCCFFPRSIKQRKIN